MIAAYDEVGGGIIVAAEEKSREETKRYGVVDPGATNGNVTEVKGVVEKPEPAKRAFQSLRHWPLYSAAGDFRRIWTPGTGAGNEIQLTDSMAR